MKAMRAADTVGVRPDDPTLVGALHDQFAPELRNPPTDWFFDQPPWFDDATKVWVDSDGRVAGWYYPAGVCIIDGNEGGCWMPTPSPTGNELFHQGSVLALEAGSPVVLDVGVIGGGGEHAPTWMTAEQAATYYADVDKQLMVGRIYDDPNRGGYFLGSILPHVTNQQVDMIRRSALSGDWRWRRTDLAGHRLQAYDAIGPWLVTRPGLPINRMGYQMMKLASVSGPDVMVGSLTGLPLEAPAGYSAPVPWHIEHQGDQYCVVNTRSGDSMGCHATTEEASRQMAALYATEPQADTADGPEGDQPQGAPEMSDAQTAAPPAPAAAAPPPAPAPPAPPADAPATDPELLARLDGLEQRVADLESMTAEMATSDLQVTDLLDI